MVSRIWFSPFWQPAWITTALLQTQPFFLQHQCSSLLNSTWFSKPWFAKPLVCKNQAISSLIEGWDRLCMSVGKLMGKGSSRGSPRAVKGNKPWSTNLQTSLRSFAGWWMNGWGQGSGFWKGLFQTQRNQLWEVSVHVILSQSISISLLSFKVQTPPARADACTDTTIKETADVFRSKSI